MCCSDRVLLREIECKHCHLLFYICRRCYRGHIYCSHACRDAAQRESHQKSQKKYRNTEKGRITHLKAERRRRMGRSKKTVDDEGTIPPPLRIIIYPMTSGTKSRCSFCGAYGVVVEEFPRRGYATRHHKRKTGQNFRC